VGKGVIAVHHPPNDGIKIWYIEPRREHEAVVRSAKEHLFTERKATIDAGVSSDQPATDYALRFTGPHRVDVTGTRGLVSLNQPFTAEMWARWSTTLPQGALMGTLVDGAKTASSRRESGWGLGTKSVDDARVEFIYTPDYVVQKSHAAPISGPSGGWHHVAVTNEPSHGVTVFVDGQELITDVKGKDGAGTDLCLGGSPFTNDRKLFHGEIRAFRLSKICRYREAFAKPSDYRFPNDEHTAANFDFSRPLGHRVADASGNGHYGKIAGAHWVSISPNRETPIPRPQPKTAKRP
jgi:hypothetical protein